jgi:succinyl-CoA synthetase alpha subunit
MAILLSSQTAVVVQGITGKEGQKATKAMLEYGTRVVAGVRPGKAGELVHGVPVYDSVADAMAAHPEINTSCVYVPPFAAKAAIFEALDAGISLVNTIVERIPIQDTAACIACASEVGARIVGPSSLGVIVPGVARLGVVGGAHAQTLFQPGPIGLISRSGGMTNEMAWQLHQAGLGISTAVHVGGDLLMGTSYADLIALFEEDAQTKAIVIFGEHGGRAEFEIAEMKRDGRCTKPVAVYIGGKFAASLPEGMTIGHAGAIVSKGQTAEEKAQILEDAGVAVCDTYEELGWFFGWMKDETAL